MSKTKVDHIAIHSKNIKKSVKWYVDKFRCEIQYQDDTWALLNFENIFIPGFGRTYDSSKVGTGFSYTLSYLLPIYKKARSKKENPDEVETTIEE